MVFYAQSLAMICLKISYTKKWLAIIQVPWLGTAAKHPLRQQIP